MVTWAVLSEVSAEERLRTSCSFALEYSDRSYDPSVSDLRNSSTSARSKSVSYIANS